MNFLNRLQPLGLLVLRLVLGAILIAHGSLRSFGGIHHYADTGAGMGIPDGWPICRLPLNSAEAFCWWLDS